MKRLFALRMLALVLAASFTSVRRRLRSPSIDGHDRRINHHPAEALMTITGRP